MALTNAYASLAELKTRITAVDTSEDSDLERALDSASRAIDDHTGRRFYVDSAATARHYRTRGERELEIKDVATLTGVAVRLDWDDDGVFEETLTLSDYYLGPVDAPADSRPYERLVMTSFRLPSGGRRDSLQVTATHGWPGATVTSGVAACPVQVKEACLLVAHRLFRRKDTPEGVAGTTDIGVVRISRYEDPDACRLLQRFRRGGAVLVA